MGKLEGKSAVVTGAGRGIGQAIALKLASEGARVLVNDLDAAPAEETVGHIRSAGGTALPFPGDITAADFGDELVRAARESHGGLDILVNNAGYIWNSAIHNHSDEQWYAMIDVHATGPFRILRAAGRYFREAAAAGGDDARPPCRKVVNITSISGYYGAATQLAYSAGKAAVIGMTRTLAKEWGRYNVTVNAVAFGRIETRLTEGYEGAAKQIEVAGRRHRVGLDQQTLQLILRMTPLGRHGTPQDAAGAVYLLAIPESDFISGQVLVCAGGLIY